MTEGPTLAFNLHLSNYLYIIHWCAGHPWKLHGDQNSNSHILMKGRFNWFKQIFCFRWTTHIWYREFCLKRWPRSHLSDGGRNTKSITWRALRSKWPSSWLSQQQWWQRMVTLLFKHNNMILNNDLMTLILNIIRFSWFNSWWEL